jgi:hypothetical protein
MPGPIDALRAYFAPPGQGTPDKPFAPWQKTLQSGVNAGVEAVQGLLGFGEETKPNLVGQMVSAGLPLVGALRPLRAVREGLDMSEAARMARAAEQGYTMPVYHGTRAEDFTSFRPPVTPVMKNLNQQAQVPIGDFGIHVTPRPETAESAVAHSGTPKFPPTPDDPNVYSEGARVMPLLARSKKALELPDIGTWHDPNHWVYNLAGTETNQAGVSAKVPESLTNDWAAAQELYDIARKYQSPDYSRPTFPFGNSQVDRVAFQQDIKDALQRRGYDTIKYSNWSEGQGEPSYLLLDPRQLRSKFAAFDPTKFGKTADLMASGVPPLALAGLQRARNQEQK